MELTNAEWKLMEALWDRSPLTGRELTEQMQAQCGWSRSTTLTLLSRMELKGAVTSDSSGGKKLFSPLLLREDAAMQETESFLERVYKGSVGLMLSSLTKKQALTKAEIDELYGILKEMEARDDA